MPHQRTVIRKAVQQILLAAPTAAGDRVHATRIKPYRRAELPALSVYTTDESIDDDGSNTAPRELTRDLALEIAGFVVPGQGVDDRMDALALQVERAMDADPFLGGTVGGLGARLAATSMAVIGEGEEEVGAVVLTYDLTYRTLAPEPPADDELDEFATAGVDYDLAGQQAPADQASDLVAIQEPPDES